MNAPSSRPDPLKPSEARQRFYALTFLSSVLAMAGLFVIAIWAPDFIGSAFGKIMASLGIIGILAAMFFLYSHSTAERMTRAPVLITCGAMGALSAMALLQIWCDVFSDDFFGKMAVTLLIVAAIASATMAIWDDFFENKRLRDENFLD